MVNLAKSGVKSFVSFWGFDFDTGILLQLEWRVLSARRRKAKKGIRKTQIKK